MDTQTLTTLQEIWIIDDNDIDVLIGTKTVERYDSTIIVHSFTKPTEALNLLKQKTVQAGNKLPDLIFLDLYMPLIDGWQFLKEFQNIMANAQTNPTKIQIVVTSSTPNEREIPKHSEYAEVIGHIMKPIDIERVKKIKNDFFI